LFLDEEEHDETAESHKDRETRKQDIFPDTIKTDVLFLNTNYISEILQ
jgi:hypothetical protein